MRSPSLPIIGIPACRRTINERVVHTVADKYPAAIIEATGCLPLSIPAIGSRIDIAALLDRLDGLLLTGSPSNVHPSEYGHEPLDDEILHDPERDATTLPLIREAVRRDLPILAICRGIQELNVALGGTLHQRLHAMPNRISHRPRKDSPDGPYGPSHSVALTPGRIARRARRQRRDHGQFTTFAGDRPARPRGSASRRWRLTAKSRGLLCPQARFVVGVQWHPEYKVLENPVSTRAVCGFWSCLPCSRCGSGAGNSRGLRESRFVPHGRMPISSFGHARIGGLLCPIRTPSAIFQKRRGRKALSKTVPSPLRARFPPNASDMQAPGLPPRPGAVLFSTRDRSRPRASAVNHGSAACDLEHQLGSASHRQCLSTDCRVGPRCTLPTRNENPGRAIPGRISLKQSAIGTAWCTG